MAPITRYVAIGTFAALISVSAVALGRHHRPFSPPPATSHMAPRQARSIVIEQHPVVEKAPLVPVAP